MTMDSVIDAPVYRYLDLPWLADLQRDQFLGGAIAWAVSEIPRIIVVAVFMARWFRYDTHRCADDDDVYRTMLDEFGRERAAPGGR